MNDVTVRRARPADQAAVAALAEATWPDRAEADYLAEAFPEWVDSEDPDRRTVVADVEGDVAGVCQARLVSDHEAWLEGMRVHPEYRSAGYGLRLVGALFEWASDRGATVARNLVYSWNEAGLGQSMAAGFEPRTAFRWARPTPRPADPSATVVSDPAAAWSFWTRSEARDDLGGLALDEDHPWVLAELTRERLRSLAERERVFAVLGNGTRAMGVRVRTTEREPSDGEADQADGEATRADGETGEPSQADGEETESSGADETERLAEYGVAAWTDEAAAEALFAAVARDAHDVGADAARVLVPETPRHVAEAAYVRAGTGEYPSFVLEADLTGAE